MFSSLSDYILKIYLHAKQFPDLCWLHWTWTNSQSTCSEFVEIAETQENWQDFFFQHTAVTGPSPYFSPGPGAWTCHALDLRFSGNAKWCLSMSLKLIFLPKACPGCSDSLFWLLFISTGQGSLLALINRNSQQKLQDFKFPNIHAVLLTTSENTYKYLHQ